MIAVGCSPHEEAPVGRLVLQWQVPEGFTDPKFVL
jgi:hypothetical protein